MDIHVIRCVQIAPIIILFNFSMQQLAKHQLKEAFVKAHLGSWVKKPIEQDMFEVDIWLSQSNDKIPTNETEFRVADYVVPTAN